MNHIQQRHKNRSLSDGSDPVARDLSDDILAILLRLSKCSKMEASINLQGNVRSNLHGDGWGNSWLALSYHHLPKKVMEVVEVSVVSAEVGRKRQKKTYLKKKQKKTYLLQRSAKVVLPSNSKLTSKGVTDVWNQQIHRGLFLVKQSWTSISCSRWHHTWRMKSVVIEGNGKTDPILGLGQRLEPQDLLLTICTLQGGPKVTRYL